MLHFDLLLRAAASLVLLSLSIRLLIKYRQFQSARVAAVLCVAVVCYLGARSFIEQKPWGLRELPWIFGSVAIPSLLWVLSLAVFRERFAVTRLHVGAVLLAIVIGLLSAYDVFLAGDASRSATLLDGVLHYLVSLCFVVLTVVECQRASHDDLVEPRRWLRKACLVVIAAYIGLVAVVETALAGDPPPPQLDLVHTLALLAAALAAWGVVARRGDQLFAVGGLQRDGARNPLHDRLEEWVKHQGYLREDLSIGILAKDLGTQEHVLRKLLNCDLGFRNFRDFLHQHRIREACRRIDAAESTDLPILALSLDLGYGSLATFNRAFKSVTGLSPTEYRNRRRPTP